MNDHQPKEFSVSEASPKLRYANESSRRKRRQLFDSSLDEQRPSEYTIYSGPSQTTTRVITYTDPPFQQIKAIYPIQSGFSARNVTCTPCKPQVLYPSNKSQTMNPTITANYPTQQPKQYINYPTSVNSGPVSSPNPNLSSISIQKPFLQNMNPLHSQRYPYPTTPTPSPVCHCPIVTSRPSTSAKSPQMTSESTIYTTTEPVLSFTQKPPLLQTSTVVPSHPTSHTPIRELSTPVTTITESSINTNPSSSVSPPPTTTTTSNSITTENLPMTTNCASNSTEGNRKCGIFVKEAIIVMSPGFGTKNISALVGELAKSDDEEENDDNEEEDENSPQNLDFSTFDGLKSSNGLFIQNASVKSSGTDPKLIDLLEKVYNELQKPKNADNADDEVAIEDFNEYDGAGNAWDDPDDYKTSETKCNKCENGHDLVEACKSLSKTISSYQQPNQNN